jgi:probable F420-dependent oxidoreductase
MSVEPQRRPIRFGTIASAATADQLIKTAESAELEGFSSVALNDQFNSIIAPLIGLQAMAGATSRIRISTAVLNQDLRHPAVLAKELATLDVLSGGRLEVGLGAGWVRADYDQSSISFDSAARRIGRPVENIAILKGLFASESYSFTGRHFTVTDLVGTPKPIQDGGPPIMIGGGGRRILSMAARQATSSRCSAHRSVPAEPSSTTCRASASKRSRSDSNGSKTPQATDFTTSNFHSCSFSW